MLCCLALICYVCTGIAEAQEDDEKLYVNLDEAGYDVSDVHNLLAD